MAAVLALFYFSHKPHANAAKFLEALLVLDRDLFWFVEAFLRAISCMDFLHKSSLSGLFLQGR